MVSDAMLTRNIVATTRCWSFLGVKASSSPSSRDELLSRFFPSVRLNRKSYCSRPKDTREEEKKGMAETVFRGHDQKYETTFNKWEAKDWGARIEDLVEDRKQFSQELPAMIKQHFWDDNIYKTCKTLDCGAEVPVVEFKSEADIKLWTIGCDSVWEEGYSTCKLELRDGGYVTFSGYLDPHNLPNDSRYSRTGWANMTLRTAPPLVLDTQTDKFDFSNYTHFRMRVRGDGRRYVLILGHKGDDNHFYSDMYIAWLPTHGGPYWQDVRIPFSNLIYSAKGKIVDEQFNVHEPADFTFNSIGISMMDRRMGPFKLDVAYMGVELNYRNFEKCCWESYTHPSGYLRDIG
ncbi:complex I intermediate-associated protein 30 [Brevipalpus obovatus]|uniref:complex I intermediate-associated protein 30 n=1 Tax=Brevipalpus obovatus TaxID=246614 RepID=UPI003D9EA46D